MVKSTIFARGEVWLADLDPTVGSEIRKTRPCLIVSPDDMNANLRRVTVMPITTGSHPAPFRVKTRFVGKDGLLLADQVRTLDRLRFKKRLGVIGDDSLFEALAILRDMFEE